MQSDPRYSGVTNADNIHTAPLTYEQGLADGMRKMAEALAERFDSLYMRAEIDRAATTLGIDLSAAPDAERREG